MRRFFYVLLLISFAVNAQNGVVVHDEKFSDIMKLARTQNKPVMLMCYATWCPHCHKMMTEVLTDPEVAKYYNANFISTTKDMESGEGITLRKQLAVKTFPTFVFLSPDGQILYRFSNELKPADFIKEGQNALDPTKQLPYLKKQFSDNVSNPDNCLTYIYALKKAGMDAAPVAKQYLATQPDDQLISATNWKIIANGVSEIESREFQHVLKNREKYAAVSSPIRVERKIINIVKEKLWPYAEAGDTLNYFKVRPSADAINLKKTDSLLFTSDLKIYEVVGNWKGYEKTALASAKTFAWDNPTLLRDIALNFAKNVSDKDALEQSIAWAERSLTMRTGYDLYLVLANLNLKIGKKEAARDWAEKGREMAVTNKWDTIRADEILSRI